MAARMAVAQARKPRLTPAGASVPALTEALGAGLKRVKTHDLGFLLRNLHDQSWKSAAAGVLQGLVESEPVFVELMRVCPNACVHQVTLQASLKQLARDPSLPGTLQTMYSAKEYVDKLDQVIRMTLAKIRTMRGNGFAVVQRKATPEQLAVAQRLRAHLDEFGSGSERQELATVLYTPTPEVSGDDDGWPDFTQFLRGGVPPKQLEQLKARLAGLRDFGERRGREAFSRKQSCAADCVAYVRVK